MMHHVMKKALSFTGCAVPVAGAALLLLVAVPSPATPELTSIALQPAGAMELTVTSSLDSYYILRRNTNGDLSAANTPEAVKAGTGAPVLLTSPVNPAARGFYHVQEVLRAASLDLDGDGMPDTFELDYPAFLNPLNPADAPLDQDNDGVSNLQEYLDGTDPSQPPLATGLVINELDYDQLGTDSNEFVEIYNAGNTTRSLSGLSLVFVNGASNAEYRVVDLTPVGTLAAGQYLVVGSNTLLATVPASAKTLYLGLPSDAIQNGAPDGVALVNVSQGAVLDALSYEGAITAAVITGFPAPVSLVEGTMLPVATQDSNTAAGSLVRFPNGMDTNNAASDWNLTGTPTPGTANVP
jgi:hypothetical protein